MATLPASELPIEHDETVTDAAGDAAADRSDGNDAAHVEPTLLPEPHAASGEIADEISDATPGDDHLARSLTRSRRIVTGLVALVVILTIVVLALATQIRSAADIATSRRAPAPRPVTAPVEFRTLAEVVIARGKVGTMSRSEVQTFVPPGAALAVVTKVKIKPGDEVSEGSLLFEVSGRPILLLSVDTPLYRDLTPGITGDDVAAVQASLSRLGYPVGADRSGTYGKATQDAVTRWYRDRGYRAQGPSPEQQNQINAARATLERARRSRAAASDPNAAAAADDDLRAATDAANALETGVGVTLPIAEVAVVTALPARVATVNAQVGKRSDQVQGPLAVLASGGLSVDALVPPGDRALIRPGMDAMILSEVLDRQATATVTAVGDAPVAADGGAASGNGSGDFAVHLEPKGPIDQAFNGQDVRVSITGARTEKPVLAVPVIAVSGRPDGSAFIRVQRSPDRVERVVVRPGLSAEGLVEVRPETEGSLKVGDAVVVG